MKRFIILLAALSMVTASCTTGVSKKSDPSEPSNKEKVTALLNSLATADPEPVQFINPNQYIQHNLMVGDGLSGFGELLKAVPKGSIKVNIVRVFSDGEYVFTHTEYDFFGPKAGFDIFRFEKGRIVEHWDNLALKAETRNPAGRTQFDGATRAEDPDKTDTNKALVKEFIDTVLVKGRMDELSRFFDGDHYLQHNPQIGDGLSGLGSALKAMAEKGVKITYDKNHKVLGEGNFVLGISEGSFAGKSVAFYDLFRVKNGKIAEHWDVIEEIPPQNTWKNKNGKFGFY
jgi:predicted SnoaL-like aldol condensation-catalyzing enzyme